MFTYHQITADSIKIANEGSKSLYYTDLTRQQEKQHRTQLKEDKNNVLYPKEEDDGIFSPACPTSINSRFVTMCLGPAGCGKSYYINKLVLDYHNTYPNSLIFYISACDLDLDPSYDTSRKYIDQIDVFQLNSSIDFKSMKDIQNSLFIYDDCDSGFSTDIGHRLIFPEMTDEEYEELPLKNKRQITKEIKDKTEIVDIYVKQSLLSMIKNGRKMGISILYVSHKPFDGIMQTSMCSECTSVVLFPASTNRDLLKKYIYQKLSLSKAQANYIMTMKRWYKFDFLEIFYRVSKPFIVTDDMIEHIPEF